MKQLGIKGIVKFIEAIYVEYRNQNDGIISQHIGLVFELMNGGTVYGLIKEQGMNEKNARFFIKQLLKQVEELHSKNCYHGDIKAENCGILIDSNTITLKLIDFGHAFIGLPNVKDPIISGRRGTKEYMSEEVQTGKFYKAAD